jgi:DNA invertase Pin-like site-specific DNA recombinase
VKTDQPTQAVIYCRVSDKKQKTDGHGLESQEVRLREHAMKQGYDVLAVFADDISGKHRDRNNLNAMFAFLRKQKPSG